MKTKLKELYRRRSGNQNGITIIIVAILMFVFLGIAAFAIDISYLFVVRNELQNAADAGALAGARFLYNDNGTAVNAVANSIACQAARDNMALSVAGAIPVDVNWGDGECNGSDNIGDVQRGHWSFATQEFTPNDSTAPVPLWGVTTAELDLNLNFINAIRVVARRDSSPAASFFARIFGHTGFELEAEAVGYIGFAGTLAPGDVDAPMAICSQSVTDYKGDGCGGVYDCNIGYMLSDGQDKNTAAWTNFSQPCETADTKSLRKLLVCGEANPDEISLGGSVGATNGVVDSVINHPTQESLMDCWKSALYDSTGDNIKDTPIDTDGDGWPDMPWNLTLPVVNCPYLQVTNCMETCGAVNVNIVWILEKENKIDDDAPRKMADWNMASEADGIKRWNSFVTHFNLKTPNGNLATYENDGFKKKSTYFLPDCTPHELKGNTGGENYGILARIPVLVR